MLRLTGRIADGLWLPSLGFLPEGPASLRAMNEQIDEAASAAGREPAAVSRLLNLSGRFTSVRRRRPVAGDSPGDWAEQIADPALQYGDPAVAAAHPSPWPGGSTSRWRMRCAAGCRTCGRRSEHARLAAFLAQTAMT
ncbi:hypothetical protein STENM327S_09021 [Streptomyces tendae]